MRYISTSTTLLHRNASAQSVIRHAKRAVGVRAPTIVKNSAKPTVRHSARKDVALDLNHETVVIYFALAAVQALHKRIVWPAETSTMTVYASKNVHQCKSTIPPIIFGSQIQMASTPMERLVSATVPDIYSRMLEHVFEIVRSTRRPSTENVFSATGLAQKRVLALESYIRGMWTSFVDVPSLRGRLRF